MSESSAVVFDQATLSVLAEIVEAAQRDAAKHGVPLPSDPDESKKLLAKRIVRLIEAGETDMVRLRERALLSTLP